MLYDGECGFCRRWIVKWQRLSAGNISYEPYQDALSKFPNVSEEECARAVQLIMPNGTHYSAARAVLEALDYAGKYRFLLHAYKKMPCFAAIAEWMYRLVAQQRKILSKLF